MLNAILIDNDIDARISLKNLIAETVDYIRVAGEYNTIEEAALYASTATQDLIFMDIGLYLNSPAATNPGDRLTPEIVFTGTEEKHAIDAIKAGCIDYLLRPVMEQEVKAMLERWQAKKLKVEKLTWGKLTCWAKK